MKACGPRLAEFEEANMKITIGVFLLSVGVSLAEVRFSAGPTGGMTLGGVTEQRMPVYGGQVAAHFDTGVSVELAVLRFTDEPVEERLGISVTADQDIMPVQLSMRLNRSLRDKRMDAYVLAGIGMYFGETSGFEIRGLVPGGPVTQTGPLEVERNDAFGYHWGVGLEWAFTGRVSGLLEYRYGIMDSNASLSGLTATGPGGQMAIEAFERDFWDNEEMGLLRIGVNGRF